MQPARRDIIVAILPTQNDLQLERLDLHQSIVNKEVLDVQAGRISNLIMIILGFYYLHSKSFQWQAVDERAVFLPDLTISHSRNHWVMKCRATVGIYIELPDDGATPRLRLCFH